MTKHDRLQKLPYAYVRSAVISSYNNAGQKIPKQRPKGTARYSYRGRHS